MSTDKSQPRNPNDVRPLEGLWMCGTFLLVGGLILVGGFGVGMVGTILHKMAGLSELWSGVGGGAFGLVLLLGTFLALS